MLAWRDMMHPKKGGAEIVTDVYLKGLAKRGHNVVLFTSGFKGGKSKEIYNGYRIIRSGGELGVYLKGLLFAFRNRKKYDRIIDQVNTIPFFTPLLISNKKRRAFFHQLCLNVWFWEKNFITATIGNILERIYLKFYRNTRAFTVSGSTKKDLINYAMMNNRNVLVLENQIDFKPISKPTRKEKKSFCFCGRLVPSKRVDECIRAISLIEDAKLYVVGDGDLEYKKRLKKLSERLGVFGRVKFLGRLSFKERNNIMKKCQAILVTSVREGWGLIVTEANANGTPAITYNIPGLRDANKTGIITKRNTPEELAKAMKNKISFKEQIEFAQSHNDWDANVERLEAWLE